MRLLQLGYRVNSKKATQFRIWATGVLREYIVKGFALDDDMLKNGRSFGQDYSRNFYVGFGPFVPVSVVLLINF